MTTDLAQFRAIRDRIQTIIQDLDGPAIPQGVMFEVPSACLEARELLEEARAVFPNTRVARDLMSLEIPMHR